MHPHVAHERQQLKFQKMVEQSNWAYKQSKLQQQLVKQVAARVHQSRMEDQIARREIQTIETQIRRLEVSYRQRKRLATKKAAREEGKTADAIPKQSGVQMESVPVRPSRFLAELTALEARSKGFEEKRTTLEDNICSMAGTATFEHALLLVQQAVENFKSAEEADMVEEDIAVLQERIDILTVQVERVGDWCKNALKQTKRHIRSPGQSQVPPAHERETTRAIQTGHKRLCLEMGVATMPSPTGQPCSGRLRSLCTPRRRQSRVSLTGSPC